MKKEQLSRGLDDLLGKNVFIRTVTTYFTGKLVAVGDTLVLDDAAWIADTGRFATALASGKTNEVEPYPDCVYVMKSAVVDISEWKHDLPDRKSVV